MNLLEKDVSLIVTKTHQLAEANKKKERLQAAFGIHNRYVHDPNHRAGKATKQNQYNIVKESSSSCCIPTFQTISWNEVYVQGVPFSSQLSSQSQFPSSGNYATEQTQFAQNQSAPPSSHLLQLPRTAVQGSTLLFAAKIEVPANPGSTVDCHSQMEHIVPLQDNSNTDIIPPNKVTSGKC
uniref:Uncharacterized protein n=1 Tax=Salvator merianae TaxID=96440 RepID=A0A8D0KNY8_SALMN